MIKAIFACDEDWGIGKDNSIPWNDRIDQKWFKESTLGKVVVMGRNTYESLTSPLSLRDNVVISNSLESIPRGFLYSGDIDTAMTQIIERFGSRDIFIIGGYAFSVLVMRVGDISFVALFRYSAVIWTLLIGFWVFGDWPDELTLLGAAIIALSGGYTMLREARIKRLSNGV